MTGYDPWAALDELDGVTLVIGELPPRRRGQVDFVDRTITLHRRLDTVERRCTLAHELVHLERGPVLIRLTPREERIVWAIAARRLVPIQALAEALRWTSDHAQLADELGVDQRTVRIRLGSLSDEERAVLAANVPALP